MSQDDIQSDTCMDSFTSGECFIISLYCGVCAHREGPSEYLAFLLSTPFRSRLYRLFCNVPPYYFVPLEKVSFTASFPIISLTNNYRFETCLFLD